MTHTLHRRGSREELKNDFVVMSMSAKTVNVKGSGEKMRRMFEILEKHPHVNFGDCKTGSKFQQDWGYIRDRFQDTSVLAYVFNDRAAVEAALRDLKEADLGLSVIVSGVVDEIKDLAREIGLKPHTIEFSGGIHGRTELLPEEPVLEITTMCGHAMVSPELVKDLVAKVRKGKKTLAQAAEELAQPCVCGIFNPKRAEYVLSKLI